MKVRILLITSFLITAFSFQTLTFADEGYKENFKVNGILDTTTAIVNNKVVRVGDYVDGAKVIEITHDFVKFIGKYGIFTRRVREEETDALQREKCDREDY